MTDRETAPGARSDPPIFRPEHGHSIPEGHLDTPSTTAERPAPPREGELAAYWDQLLAVDGRVQRCLDGLSPDGLNWQPEPGRWSIGQHLDHLITTWNLYRPPIQGAIDEGRSRDLRAEGPFRHGWFGNFFIRFVEPPPRMKTRAPGPFQPQSEPLTLDELRAGFATSTSEMMTCLREADGLNLSRLRLTSPITSLIRFSLGQSFGVVLAHARRHLWHVDRIAVMPDLPGESDRR